MHKLIYRHMPDRNSSGGTAEADEQIRNRHVKGILRNGTQHVLLRHDLHSGAKASRQFDILAQQDPVSPDPAVIYVQGRKLPLVSSRKSRRAPDDSLITWRR